MATCAASSALVATPRVMLPLCALVFSDGPRSVRVARSAGPTPNRTAVVADRDAVNARTLRSMRASTMRGSGFWEPQHELFPPPGEDGAADPAEDSQEETFGQQLPNDPPAARAECQSHRDLLAARGRADQEQVREIETPDQQNEGDDGEHDGQDLLCIKARAVGSLSARADAELWHAGPRGIRSIGRARGPAFTHRLRQMPVAARRAPVPA